MSSARGGKLRTSVETIRPGGNEPCSRLGVNPCGCDGYTSQHLAITAFHKGCLNVHA
ncbi:hypothetical protein EMIT0347P_90027 [Pseudomonas sp. IT-347P]